MGIRVFDAFAFADPGDKALEGSVVAGLRVGEVCGGGDMAKDGPAIPHDALASGASNGAVDGMGRVVSSIEVKDEALDVFL
jgi:hypothetical protein